MAGSIRGITIEFRGETTQLDKALKDIDRKTRDIDAELKQVNKDLKFNPKSVELWRQKQNLLKEKISETEKRLETLKAAQDKMDADKVDKSSREYQQLRREIIETESKLKTFNGQLAKSKAPALKAASAQFEEMGNKLTMAGEKMMGFSKAAGVVTGALAALTVKSGKWADDLNTMAKVYSLDTKQLQLYGAAADLVDVDVNTIAASHVKLEKAMSSAADGSKKTSAAFKELGVDITDSNGNLRDGDEVWQDVIKALGSVENETQRDALAMKLLGKSALELNPLIEDGGETYANLAQTMSQYNLDFIDQETLDKANQFNDQLDTMKAVGTVALQSVGSQLAAYLLPYVEKLAEYVSKFAEWLGSLDPEILAIIGAISAVVAVVGPLLLILGKVAFAISSIINLLSTIGPALGALATGPVGLIVAAIAAAIAIGVLLYKNWDVIKAKALAIWNTIKTTVGGVIDNIKTNFETFKTNLINGWEALKQKATSIFNAIKEAITHPIQTAKNLIQTAINKIKSIFGGLKLQLPKFKLPHFKISAGKAPWGIGGKGEKPSFDVDWYAQGGIFDSPRIVGIGEAGPEAVIPLDTLWSKLDRIANAAGGDVGGVTINVYGGSADPQAIALEVERRLVKLQKQRANAWT